MRIPLILLALAFPVMADREFGAVPQRFGHLPSNTFSTNLHGASGITVAAHVYPYYFLSTDSNDVMVGWFGSSACVNLRIGTGGSSQRVVFGGRRLAADTSGSRVSASNLTANQWTHIAGTATYSGTFPNVYINGSLSNGSTLGVALTSGTFESSSSTLPDGVGAVPTIPFGLLNTNRVFNGRLAELAVWRTALTTDEIASLASGAAPFMVRPASLVFYAPLTGRETGTEWNYVGIPVSLTNSPAAGTTHPRIFRP